MRQPYKKPVDKARADIKLPEPRVSIFVILLLKVFGRLYLFLFYGIARIVLKGDKSFLEAWKRALAGKSRCIIAFRHPNGGEPQLLTWFILFRLRLIAAFRGVRFSRQPHAVFVYGYEVARWGGWVARYILPRVGGMPIHHSKVDRHGMARIFKAVMDGPYPVALAPEGQVSYNADILPRLEQGVMRIGFHVAGRLAENNGPDVEVLPVAIHYRFGTWGIMTTESLIKKIEKYTNPDPSERKRVRKLSYTERLTLCREHILSVNEKRYKIPVDTEKPFNERLDAVIEAAFAAAERILDVKTQGDVFSRMYSMRQTCWDRIALPDVDSMDAISGVERGTLDLAAGEAWHAGRHLELVDLAWYFRIPVPANDAPLHQRIEYAQNLWDFASRSMGGAYSDRTSILPRRVVIQSAPPINISERLPAYRKDKSAAVEAALVDLEKAYLDCIDKVNQSE
jgi:hypothetical protein